MVTATTSVLEAVLADLAAIGEADRWVASSGEAAACVALAREIDDPSTPASSKSMCARSLGELLGRLRERAPARAASDNVASLEGRARVKLAGRAAS